jgi:hypothetical protein
MQRSPPARHFLATNRQHLPRAAEWNVMWDEGGGGSTVGNANICEPQQRLTSCILLPERKTYIPGSFAINNFFWEISFNTSKVWLVHLLFEHVSALLAPRLADWRCFCPYLRGFWVLSGLVPTTGGSTSLLRTGNSCVLLVRNWCNTIIIANWQCHQRTHQSNSHMINKNAWLRTRNLALDNLPNVHSRARYRQ